MVSYATCVDVSQDICIAPQRRTFRRIRLLRNKTEYGHERYNCNEIRIASEGNSRVEILRRSTRETETVSIIAIDLLRVQLFRHEKLAWIISITNLISFVGRPTISRINPTKRVIVTGGDITRRKTETHQIKTCLSDIASKTPLNWLLNISSTHRKISFLKKAITRFIFIL